MRQWIKGLTQCGTAIWVRSDSVQVFGAGEDAMFWARPPSKGNGCLLILINGTAVFVRANTAEMAELLGVEGEEEG